MFLGSAAHCVAYQKAAAQAGRGYHFVRAPAPGSAQLQNLAFWARYLPRNQVEELVLACGPEHWQHSKRLCALCLEMGLTLRLLAAPGQRLPGFAAALPVKRSLCAVGPFRVLTCHTVPTGPAMKLKRAADVVGAAALLAATAPLVALAAAAIRLDSPGPALFWQRRVGRCGRPFTLVKLRTMHEGAERQRAALMPRSQVPGGLMLRLDGDPRVTRAGAFLRRFCIDELPQLLNVLWGDMSLVGTRPPTPDEVARYRPHHFRRISMRPGITGMWQVLGRGRPQGFAQVVKLDTAYIDDWSLWLDAKLLLLTLPAVLLGRGGT